MCNLHRSGRFYIPPENILKDKNLIIVGSEEKHHIRDVLRIKTDEKIIVFDGCGSEYQCSIIREEKGKLILNIQKKIKTQHSLFKLTLAVAMPKKRKLDYIIQKATELQTEDIIPMITQRSIVKLDRVRSEKNLLRWNKIAIEASKQSKRLYIPKIHKPESFLEVLKLNKNYDLSIIACLDKKAVPIKEVLERTNVRSVLALVGPEGGFSQEEIGQAINKNFIPVWLGDCTLKTDTACIFLISVINYSFKK